MVMLLKPRSQNPQHYAALRHDLKSGCMHQPHLFWWHEWTKITRPLT